MFSPIVGLERRVDFSVLQREIRGVVVEGKGVQEIVERFRKDGVVSEQTQIYLTHIGHKGGLNHTELLKKMREMIGPQIDVAYDGLRLADF